MTAELQSGRKQLLIDERAQPRHATVTLFELDENLIEAAHEQVSGSCLEGYPESVRSPNVAHQLQMMTLGR
jgi:hypothetical protein